MVKFHTQHEDVEHTKVVVTKHKAKNNRNNYWLSMKRIADSYKTSGNPFYNEIQQFKNDENHVSITSAESEYRNNFLIVNSNGGVLDYQFGVVYLLLLNQTLNNQHIALMQYRHFTAYCQIVGMTGYVLGVYKEIIEKYPKLEITDLKSGDNDKNVFVLSSINYDTLRQSMNPKPESKLESKLESRFDKVDETTFETYVDIFVNPDVEQKKSITAIEVQRLLIRIALYYGNISQASDEITEYFNSEKTSTCKQQIKPGYCLVSGGYKHRKSKKSRKTNKRKTNKK